MDKLYVIYTDSFSAISALRSISSSKNCVAHKIYVKFQELTANKVVMEWIPSYCGIKGNETADKIANGNTSQAIMHDPIFP